MTIGSENSGLYPTKKTQTRRSIVAQNVTVDDTLGDPTNNNHFIYSPDSSWSQGNGCSRCAAVLNTSLVSNGTWHDTTWSPPSSSPVHSASVQFNGTYSLLATYVLRILIRFSELILPPSGSAVYVYCILTGSISEPIGNSDMTFFIDNQQVGAFVQAPDGNTNYRYNSLVYSNADLELGVHTFRLETAHLGERALVLLDYLIYT